MKKQLLFWFATATIIQTTTYAQENTIPSTGNVGIGTTVPQAKLDVNGKVKIDSTLFVKDSVIIQKNLRVEQNVHFLGQTRMNNSRVSGNFISETNARFDGTLRFPALELPNNMNNKNIVITNANGLAQKVPFDTVVNILKSNIYAEPALVDFYCTNIAPIAPTWANGPYKIYSRCPDVKVGIGTIDPTHGLHVTTNSRFRQSKVDVNMGIGAEPNSVSTLFIQNEIRPTSIQIKQTGNTHTYQKLLSFEYDEPTTEILKAYNPQTGTTSYLLEASGKMTIHNGTRKIFQLEADGLLRARTIKVDTDTWADYVFKPTYQLMALKDVELFIQQHGHLPNIPSEQEMLENGVDLVEMNIRLLEKIEELTLHTIEMEKELRQVQSKLAEVKK